MALCEHCMEHATTCPEAGGNPTPDGYCNCCREIARLQALLKNAVAVCDAVDTVREALRDFSKESYEEAFSKMLAAHDAYLAGKQETDDG